MLRLLGEHRRAKPSARASAPVVEQQLNSQPARWRRIIARLVIRLAAISFERKPS